MREARHIKARAKGMRLIARAKTLWGCSECGFNSHPAALDFHHRDAESKLHNVAWLARSGAYLKLKAEIRKCDLLCANCHRIHTHSEVV